MAGSSGFLYKMLRSSRRVSCAEAAVRSPLTRVQRPGRSAHRFLLSSRQRSNSHSLPYSTATTTPESAIHSKPSRLRRFLTVCGLGIVFSTAGFMMATASTMPVIQEMLHPPSDEATLSMFMPQDERISEINAYMIDHPVVQQLRQNPDFRESRPHMKIPEALRPQHLTSGVLGGPGRIEVPPLMFIEKEGRGGVTLLYLGTNMCGHPGIIHGGALATLLDESLARCCFGALPNKVAMTANLNIDYKKPLPAGNFILIRSKTIKVEGRKAWVEGTIESLPVEGEPPVIYSAATALFIEPKSAQTMSRLYPVSS